MRVQHGDDSETYEIAEDPTTHEPASGQLVGMTPDGSKVYFTSEQPLTGEDQEHGGASLFMWSAEKAENGEQPLTLISKGPSEASGEPGNSAGCKPRSLRSAATPVPKRAGRFRRQRRVQTKPLDHLMRCPPLLGLRLLLPLRRPRG